jgi:DNA-binding LacI/PurR family transcriptional regulator
MNSRTGTQALYKGIVQDVRTRVAKGELAAGSRLPSITAMCRKYGVSTITVRTALRELCAEGVIESRPRSGMFVRRRAQQSDAFGFLQNAIAVLSPLPIDLEENTSGGWSRAIGQGANWEIQAAGFHAFALHPDRFCGQEIERFAHERPVGVVFTELHPHWNRAMQVAQALRRHSVPFVVYGGAPELASYDRVVSDHEAGSYELTRFLIAQGRRRLLNVWTAPATGYWFARRRAGYEKAVAEAGLEPLPDLIVPPLTAPHGRREAFASTVRRLASFLIEPLCAVPPVDALLMSTDIDAIGAAAACRLFGKTPNEDVAIVGYDNFWSLCSERQFEPCLPLATMDKRDREMGVELVRLLLDRVAGRLPDEPQSRIIAPRLVRPEL